MKNLPPKRTILPLIILLGLILLAGQIFRPAVFSQSEPAVSAATRQSPSAQDQTAPQTGEINAVSVIISDSPTCSLPIPNTGSCYINWRRIYVSTNTGYLNTLTIKIDGRFVAVHRGFFQQTMETYDGFYGDGFRVNCGLPGAGGNADFGKVYSYEIRATDTTLSTGANYGSVTCPYDIVRVYLPAVVK